MLLPLPIPSADLDQVLQRSLDTGVEKIIVTAGSLEESHQALDFVQSKGISFKLGKKSPFLWPIISSQCCLKSKSFYHCGVPSNPVLGV